MKAVVQTGVRQFEVRELPDPELPDDGVILRVTAFGVTPGYPGGFAEKLVISGEVLTNGVMHPIPDNLPDELAALAEPCSSVLASHLKTDTSFNDAVVVIGAGPIGKP